MEITLCSINENDNIIFHIVLVNDMIIKGNVISGIKKLQTYLDKEFEMKDLEILKYLLALKYLNPSKGVFSFNKNTY